MAFNESNSWTLMFQKVFKKGALPARKVSPLMPINCLINSEQFMNNSWTIRVPNKINSCSRKQFVRPPKNESCLDEPIHEHTWRGKRKEHAEKTNNFERFFGDSTLTFLTFGNIFYLPILPTRCLVLLRGRERKIWGRQIKIRGRQIFPGCAPKIPVFKGKEAKKGRSRGSSHISVQI